MTTPAKFYLPQLDGLRFLAFFLVFLHHYTRIQSPLDFFATASLPHWITEKLQNFGWIGVDIFLCLSSFLLTSLLIMEHQQTGTLSVKQFFIRRSLRIWPLYYGMLLLVFFILPQSHFLPELNTELYTLSAKQHLLPYSLFLGNFSYAYFVNSLIAPIASLWTISLEEQFYLFWPLLLFILLPRKRKWLFSTLAGVLFLSIVVRYYIISNGIPYPTVWVFTLGRLDPFVFGALLSYLYLHPKRPPRPVLSLCLGLIFLGMLLNSDGVGINNSAWHLLIADLAVAFFIYAALYSVRLGRLLSLRPLRWLGKISFGLYVFHVIAVQAMLEHFVVHWTKSSLLIWCVVFCLTLILTILLASASYYGFEKHFLKLKSRFTVIASRPA